MPVVEQVAVRLQPVEGDASLRNVFVEYRVTIDGFAAHFWYAERVRLCLAVAPSSAPGDCLLCWDSKPWRLASEQLEAAEPPFVFVRTVSAAIEAVKMTGPVVAQVTVEPKVPRVAGGVSGPTQVPP